MIRATLRMRVRPGGGAAFERAFAAVADATSREPANLRQSLLRGDEPDSYVITSDWASLDAFRAFESSPEQDRLTAPLRELRLSADMRVDEIVRHVDAAEPETRRADQEKESR
ncbi:MULTISPECIES: antibiotic biosynthesis monooxygenase family protein [Actinomadura]|uniref:Antibiotic biosynthesis monooxygenase n=1 Tax=Actinomadura litoris TaxID=2678616 RepID=A0A7K1L211_9ACTN|nr:MULTISPECIES: antibiotic biosynthesis monooxygenase family protein [Actinomadura]MBT2208993.1 antibiotic biosynthesis monooxygenase [Actinomadura sp. NEAU-AAG7]MUN38442.1 antibiotic biosynthesis monooxygenase [Actinomadura litoris]